ncbi:signal peptidase II [Rhodococcus sp. 06-418-5]|uniref:signal peptidase II n=1 Tax=unclassified Rhodococcus (in: high G+C Gram-positive bacteria) TaxID=192944 RepID=UPI000B9C4B8F|nr:signal peptidase II [Rhodococcus sp. 06-470-2]OZC80056.1 signal peptidase II [Rhodococcus sp. 06-418-5]OZE04137.1 signal peptidase II [Rhodococcus sp. 05-2255-3C]OZE10729.1 signal peptidase II [Rhodococcus sp. 05-2255-3B1]OZE20805.1 signal peptidase II [Rhodococcus sp. 05-2255-2A2]OZE56881.1 signal peptidase II [Rhodococcus sp. 05-2221-1B]
MSEDRADDPPAETSSVPAPNETADSQVTEADSAEIGLSKPLKTRLLIVIAAVILLFDLVTKILVVHYVEPGNPIEIVGDVVTLRLVRNPGAAFSMATGMTWLLTVVAVAVVIGVIKIGRTLRSPWWALGLGLVLGGALGNLIDRFFRAPGPFQGHVVDFVSVGWWPVFNVADSSIVCGAILLVVLSLFGFEPNGERAGKSSSDAAGEADK